MSYPWEHSPPTPQILKYHNNKGRVLLKTLRITFCHLPALRTPVAAPEGLLVCYRLQLFTVSPFLVILLAVLLLLQSPPCSASLSDTPWGCLSVDTPWVWLCQQLSLLWDPPYCQCLLLFDVSISCIWLISSHPVTICSPVSCMCCR